MVKPIGTVNVTIMIRRQRRVLIQEKENGGEKDVVQGGDGDGVLGVKIQEEETEETGIEYAVVSGCGKEEEKMCCLA